LNLPLVSILIPLYNAQAHIAETIENMLAQSYRPIEIIIVDDGSTDESLAIARAYEAQYEQVKVYAQPNCGAPRARNFAFSKSSGEYIQYMDADDLMSKDKIAMQMDLVKQYGPDAIYMAGYQHFYRQVEDGRYQPQAIDRSFDSGMAWLIASWSGGGFGTIMGWLTPRHHIERAGAWNEDLKKNQDGEFFARVLLGVGCVVYVPQVRVYYRKTGATSISSQFREEAARSTLDSYRCYEMHVANIEHPQLSKALAYTYLSFVRDYYPHFPHLIREAEAAMARLGYDYFSLETPGKLGPISRIVGSKNIIRLRYLLRWAGVYR
jgi:glycosyltransferase involved in cell wall biosynthesis